MKDTKWVIIRIGATGVKTRGGIVYNTYETACMEQEILEVQNPHTAFLIYTLEECEKEIAEGLIIR